MGRLGALRCLLAALLFGASAPAAAGLVGSLPAVLLAGLLYVGAGCALLPATLRRPPTRAALRADIAPVAVAVVAGGALAPVLLMVGLRDTGAATASLLLNLELVATVSLSALLFRDQVGRRVLLGAGLVTAAGVALVWQPGAKPSGGALAVAAACLLWGLDNSVTARVDQLAPQHLVVAKGAVAGVANTVLGLLTAGAAARSSISPGAIGAALLVGALGYGVSMVLWVKGARDLGAARAQLLFATAPFIGVLVAWLVRGEHLGVAHAVALPLAAAGVVVAARSGHEHPHLHVAVDHVHEHRHDDHHRHGHADVPSAASLAGRHTHRHEHEAAPAEAGHAHPHVPDLHHRHEHD